MKEKQAIERAIESLKQRGETLPIKEASARWMQELHAGMGRAGWQVLLLLDIEMDPNDVVVEVYDDTEEVIVVPMV